MKPLRQITSIAIPLIRNNIDTDCIIPSREMKSVSKHGLSEGLFAGWRYTEIGGRTPQPDFVLNDPAFADAQILLAGENMGCGSSREHAAWALSEYGIRVVIAPSFNPIFRGNCVRNGILPIQLKPQPLAESTGPLTVDLEACCISNEAGETWTFTLDDEARTMLLEGLDPIDITLKMLEEIESFRTHDAESRPWIYLGKASLT